jgi:hypothetical protein
MRMATRTTFRLLTTAFCVFSLGPFDAFGWSVEGHQTVAIIAATQLQGTNTSTRISALLGALSLPDIALCPDEVRNLEEHHTTMSVVCSQIFPVPPTGTGPGHFVNTPIKQPTFTPTALDITAACHNNCVTVKIASFLAVLAAAKPTDPPAKKLEEVQALSFVVHFIGDVHQPLHAADRNGDLGGNAEHVRFFNQIGKLHGIWDSQIVAKIDSTPAALATDLQPEIATAKSEPASTPVDWAIQSYVFARDVAYKDIPAANGTHAVAILGQPYQDSAAKVVRPQIARAGVRLAAALKKALP